MAVGLLRRYEDVACDLSRQFTIERGRTECEPCTGKSTDDFVLASEIKLFSDQCLVCAAGKYCDGDEGNAKPYPCPVGKYQDEPGVSCRDIFGTNATSLVAVVVFLPSTVPLVLLEVLLLCAFPCCCTFF